MDTAVSELIEFLKGMSPVVWETLLQQARNEAIAKLIWGIVFFWVSYLLFQWVKKEKQRYDEYYNDGEFLTSDDHAWLYLALAVTVSIAFGLLVSAVLWLSNPEFYAIKFLIQTIGQ